MEQRLRICASLDMRWSITPLSSHRKYYSVDGFYYEYRFRLYSPELKRTIGTVWRTTCAAPIKLVKKAKWNTPEKKQPNSQLQLKALVNLLMRNAGMDTIQEKQTRKRIICIELDVDELAVYWLTNYKAIAALDKDSRTDIDRQTAFAKVCAEVGDFRLSRFCTPIEREQFEACDELVAGIKRGLGRTSGESTRGTGDTTKVIRLAIQHYLDSKGIYSKRILERLTHQSNPPQTVQNKIGENMRPQAIPLERFRKICLPHVTKLSSSGAKNKAEADFARAMLLILILGLTPEEVCGLNQDDLVSIPNQYHANSLCISHVFRCKDSVYNLEKNSARRLVPLPYPLSSFLYKVRKDITEGEPMLTDALGERLKPESLKTELAKAFESTPNLVEVDDKAGKIPVNLAVLHSSYRANCRLFWGQNSNLDEGEIRYLQGLAPKDTLSAHYIDYSNEKEQYRMLKQLEHAIALITRTAEASAQFIGPIPGRGMTLYGDDKNAIGALLEIKSACRLSIASWRGVHVEKEEHK